MFIVGLLVVYIGAINLSDAQVTIAGKCPNVPAKPNLDLHQYGGVWFELEKYLFLPEIVGRCVYVRYKNFRYENATFEAEIVHVDKLSRKTVVNNGNARVISSDGSGQIDLHVLVSVPLVPVGVKVNYPYTVLETDYRTYSIKWACLTVGIYNFQAMWVLGRTRTYLPETRDIVHQTLRDLGLRPELLITTDNSNCPEVSV